ncbi:MAG: glycoside hydrolase family 5 protein [Polyangiaceae bacterium]
MTLRYATAVLFLVVGCGGGDEGGSGSTGGAAGASGGAAGSGGIAGASASGGSGASAGASGSGATGSGGASGSGATGSGGASGSGATGSGGTTGSGGAGTGGGGSAAWYAGVNLSGAEFGEGNLPGTYNTHYTYPTAAEFDYFIAKGMNTFRVPFRWERLQHSKGAALDATELARLDAVVTHATGKNAYVILDPHNYARYFGDVIGGGKVANADYADFWSKLAGHYKSNPRVIIGLMNEPHDLPTEQWLSAANAAIAAVRAAGANQLVLVPGNAWTGAHSWSENWYGTANSQVMGGISDSQNNFAFELHQYLDANFSGTQGTCQSATIGSQKLVDVTNWLKAKGYRGFLGELGGANNPTCKAAVDDMLTYLKQHQDVWIGWTWWAAGPWWGNYMFTLEPTNLGSNPVDAPQLAWLTPYL